MNIRRQTKWWTQEDRENGEHKETDNMEDTGRRRNGVHKKKNRKSITAFIA